MRNVAGRNHCDPRGDSRGDSKGGICDSYDGNDSGRCFL